MWLMLKSDTERVSFAFYFAFFPVVVVQFFFVMKFKTKIPKHVPAFYSCYSALPVSFFICPKSLILYFLTVGGFYLRK